MTFLDSEFNSHFIAGETSGEHRRKALPTIPSLRRRATVERHRVLSFATSVQIRALRQKAHRRPTILPRQAARGDRLRALYRDPRESAGEQVGEQTGYGAE